MDVGEKLQIRAEAAAEAFLTESFDKVYTGSLTRFTEAEVDALRQTFKLGWMTGYRGAMLDTAAQLERLVSDVGT